jgi:hypothetical protein
VVAGASETYAVCDIERLIIVGVHSVSERSND